MPSIVIVDTSVFMNVLDVPGFNQDREADLARFRELIEAGANLLLPVAAIFEAGNHIAQLADGRQRRRRAERSGIGYVKRWRDRRHGRRFGCRTTRN